MKPSSAEKRSPLRRLWEAEKKKVREYDIIKQNIDSILQADRQPERGKGNRARNKDSKIPPLCYDRAIKMRKGVEHGKPENAGI